MRLGLEVDGGRIVDAGLKAGEEVVVEGLVRVRPSSLLAPQRIELAHNYGPKPNFADQPARLKVGALSQPASEVVQ